MNDMDEHSPRERAGGPAVEGRDMATLTEQ